MVSMTKAQLRWPCVDTQAGDTGYPAVGVSSGKKRKCNLQWHQSKFSPKYEEVIVVDFRSLILFDNVAQMLKLKKYKGDAVLNDSSPVHKMC